MDHIVVLGHLPRLAQFGRNTAGARRGTERQEKHVSYAGQGQAEAFFHLIVPPIFRIIGYPRKSVNLDSLKYNRGISNNPSSARNVTYWCKRRTIMVRETAEPAG